MKKVLIVTLYSGENEFQECCDSVDSQQGVVCTHKIYKNLPKREAHESLYNTFNAGRGKYDFFVKLDADMAFSTKHSLTNLLALFYDNVDVVSATVRDGLTGMDMDAVHIYSSRCFFHYESGDDLFTDQVRIDYPGLKCKVVDVDCNVLHAFNPSEFQAFIFGVHRGMKVMQYGTRFPRINDSYHQRKIISNAYYNYKNNDFSPSRFALVGAGLVFDGIIKDSALYQKKDYEQHFLSYRDCEIYDNDPRFMRSDLLSLIQVLGLTRFFLSALSYIYKKVF